ncbi:MAG: Omp28-related outer membrane protein [Bacteroidales bacterium]|nr:Omp28-related outer membrane protein [Bacteroidales bacterium]
MKKILSFVLLGLLTVTMLPAQTDQFVSTAPSNKKVVLEEYTGINCTWCPDGHKVANQIMAQHPGEVCLINVHAGSYAANTYTTQFGNALANQTGLTGYPSGTVNRHVFSGSATALSRGDWASAANQILSTSSPVNIAARGTLDWTTRELNLTVQLYYTADEANATNMLNVAIIQDNVLGSQVGMSLNPDQVVGSQYRHMHMLRHLITGQWGEEITTTTQGSFVEKNYTYTIPTSMGSPNAIPAPVEDLHFIVFVAQGHQEILTGCEAEITNVNLPALYPRLYSLSNTTTNECNNEATVRANVLNAGSDAITSLTMEYSVANGTPMTFNWTGNIAPSENEDINLPVLYVNTNVNQQVKARITAVNGQAYDGAQLTVAVKKYLAASDGAMTIKIKTDSYASETSYKIYGPNGNVVQQSSNFTNSAVNEFPFNPTELGCYRLQVLDSYGDGISGGYIRVYDANNNMLFSIAGSGFTSESNSMIKFTSVGIADVENDNEMVVYPNPANNMVHISGMDNVQMVEVFNLQGQRVAVENGNVHEIAVSGLASGMYILRVTTDEGVRSCRIAKN